MPRAQAVSYKGQIEAKNGLGNYCVLVRNTLRDEKLKEKFFNGDEDEKIKKAVRETFKWLNKNPWLKKAVYDAKRKEFEGIVSTIMTRAHPMRAMCESSSDEEDEGEESEEESEEEEELGLVFARGSAEEEVWLGKGTGKDKVKSDDPAKGKGKDVPKPPEPAYPPPRHLLRPGPYTGASGSGLGR